MKKKELIKREKKPSKHDWTLQTQVKLSNPQFVKFLNQAQHLKN
jgi:hypothetical protein